MKRPIDRHFDSIRKRNFTIKGTLCFDQINRLAVLDQNPKDVRNPFTFKGLSGEECQIPYEVLLLILSHLDDNMSTWCVIRSVCKYFVQIAEVKIQRRLDDFVKPLRKNRETRNLQVHKNNSSLPRCCCVHNNRRRFRNLMSLYVSCSGYYAIRQIMNTTNQNVMSFLGSFVPHIDTIDIFQGLPSLKNIIDPTNHPYCLLQYDYNKFRSMGIPFLNSYLKHNPHFNLGSLSLINVGIFDLMEFMADFNPDYISILRVSFRHVNVNGFIDQEPYILLKELIERGKFDKWQNVHLYMKNHVHRLTNEQLNESIQFLNDVLFPLFGYAMITQQIPQLSSLTVKKHIELHGVKFKRLLYKGEYYHVRLIDGCDSSNRNSNILWFTHDTENKKSCHCKKRSTRSFKVLVMNNHHCQKHLIKLLRYADHLEMIHFNEDTYTGTILNIRNCGDNYFKNHNILNSSILPFLLGRKLERIICFEGQFYKMLHSLLLCQLARIIVSIRIIEFRIIEIKFGPLKESFKNLKIVARMRELKRIIISCHPIPKPFPYMYRLYRVIHLTDSPKIREGVLEETMDIGTAYLDQRSCTVLNVAQKNMTPYIYPLVLPLKINFSKER
jgi:hypothetical protein